jgi:hypothetical protein
MLVFFFPETEGGSLAVLGKRAALGGGVEEGEGGDEVAEKVARLLLLRLVQTETRGRL